MVSLGAESDFVIVSYLVVDLLQTTRPFDLGWFETAELPGMNALRGVGAFSYHNSLRGIPRISR